MPQFQYKAKDTVKGTVSGIVEAENSSTAAKKVRDMGYWPMDIVPAKGDPRAAARKQTNTPRNDVPDVTSHSILPSVSPAKLAFFWQQFSTMLHSGLPFTQIFRMLAQHSQGSKIRNAANDILAQITKGSQISEAMANHPRVFAPEHVQLMKAGEMGGQIEQMADLIGDDLMREVELRRRITSAMVYPVILILAMIFIPYLPKLILGSVKEYIEATFFPFARILVTIAATYFGGKICLKIPGIAFIYDNIKLALPIVGKTIRRFTTARYCRTLANLYQSGVPVTKAMITATSVCKNRIMRRKLAEQITHVEQGGSISQALSRANVFDSVVLSVAAVGEESGDISTLLNKISGYLEEEGKATIQRALVVGTVILFLIIAICIAIQVINGYTGLANSMMQSVK